MYSPPSLSHTHMHTIECNNTTIHCKNKIIITDNTATSCSYKNSSNINNNDNNTSTTTTNTSYGNHVY